MDDTTTLFGRLSAQLDMLARGQAGEAALARFGAAGIDVGHCATPLELAHSCHGTGGVERSRAVVAGLLSLAPDDELACLTVLVALAPGLANLVHHLAVRGWGRVEAESAVVRHAFEVIAGSGRESSGTEGDEPNGRVLSAADVVARTRAGVRREERRERRRREVPWGSGFEAEAVGADPAERVATVLFDAVASGALTDGQALVVGATRSHDVDLADVARALGVSSPALNQARWRAERRLSALLRAQEEER